MARSLAASTTTATTTMPLWVAKTFRPALYAPDMRAFGVCRLVHANLHRRTYQILEPLRCPEADLVYRPPPRSQEGARRRPARPLHARMSTRRGWPGEIDLFACNPFHTSAEVLANILPVYGRMNATISPALIPHFTSRYILTPPPIKTSPASIIIDQEQETLQGTAVAWQLFSIERLVIGYCCDSDPQCQQSRTAVQDSVAAFRVCCVPPKNNCTCTSLYLARCSSLLFTV